MKAVSSSSALGVAMKADGARARAARARRRSTRPRRRSGRAWSPTRGTARPRACLERRAGYGSASPLQEQQVARPHRPCAPASRRAAAAAGAARPNLTVVVLVARAARASAQRSVHSSSWFSWRSRRGSCRARSSPRPARSRPQVEALLVLALDRPRHARLGGGRELDVAAVRAHRHERTSSGVSAGKAASGRRPPSAGGGGLGLGRGGAHVRNGLYSCQKIDSHEFYRFRHSHRPGAAAAAKSPSPAPCSVRRRRAPFALLNSNCAGPMLASAPHADRLPSS